MPIVVVLSQGNARVIPAGPAAEWASGSWPWFWNRSSPFLVSSMGMAIVAMSESLGGKGIFARHHRYR